MSETIETLLSIRFRRWLTSRVSIKALFIVSMYFPDIFYYVFSILMFCHKQANGTKYPDKSFLHKLCSLCVFHSNGKQKQLPIVLQHVLIYCSCMVEDVCLTWATLTLLFCYLIIKLYRFPQLIAGYRSQITLY